MMELQKVILHQNKTFSIKRQHPWIFSGAILKKDHKISDGDMVDVFDEQGQFLGFGHFHLGSIAVKMLSFGSKHFTDKFWKVRLLEAFQSRQKLISAGLIPSNAYRLVHGESDGLPGLIIDVYKDVAVIQCHTIGMHRHIDQIVEAIKSVNQLVINSVFDKSCDSLPTEYARLVGNKFILGNEGLPQITENELLYEINIVQGQKTGFFLDQRDNRLLVKVLSQSRTVLNAFCYTGGFSLSALRGGATRVVSIDSSAKAMELLEHNLQLNNLQDGRHQSQTEDVISYFKQIKDHEFDLIILDPPAFAKTLAKRHTAIQAYKRLNLGAILKIKCPGYLFTFSCSQVVTEELFYSAVVAAGIESGKRIKIIKRLSQAPDHPVSLFHPEGSYLKGLLLEITD
ncbi:MAG: class I SAM-dependent rRNA methyltransferase [Saprospiraceae bacterium]